jgi:transmembrane sensor
MDKELLEKYFKNACTEEELNSVLEWFEWSARSPEGKALLSKIWEEMHAEESGQKADFDLILDKIHHKINLKQSEELLEKSGQNLIKYKRREYLIKTLMRAAALLMLPVLGFAVYMSVKYQSAMVGQMSVNQAYNEISSSVDAITKVILPDGTNVWLNHSSVLRYPSSFTGKSRNVELSGEGYFEVAHNPKIPFIVKAGEIQVLARGTTFNVLAYPDEDRIETSLINGSVELRSLDARMKVVNELLMKPSDLTVYRKSSKEFITRTIEDERYYSWKEGKLIFKKEPMAEVIKKLSRWFNVDIKLKDPELLDLTYTATFVHETLPEVMELLRKVTPLNYTISSRELKSDGTFTKRKVILSYRKK